MDTITHGILGALIGKGLFADDPSPLAPSWKQAPTSAGRVAILSATAGAIFPDIDIFAGPLAHNSLALMTWHRNITHSIVMLPVFAVALAALSYWLAGRLEWPAPTFATLVAIYAVTLGSHIFLDLITSFGTMVWSPLDYSRPAWDWIFIIDLSFTALVLLPQLAAWGFRGRKTAYQRNVPLFGICSATAFGIVLGVQRLGVPVPTAAAAVVTFVCAIFFILPLRRGTGTRVGRGKWCRIGLGLGGAYLAYAATMHHSALQQVTQFAREARLNVLNVAALPLPPSVASWAGLIETPDGVYRLQFNEFGSEPVRIQVFNNAPDNRFIAAARDLRDVQIFLWFARFPFFQYSEKDGQPTVRITDLRFLGDRPRAQNASPQTVLPPGTFQVVFTPDGRVVSVGRLGPD